MAVLLRVLVQKGFDTPRNLRRKREKMNKIDQTALNSPVFGSAAEPAGRLVHGNRTALDYPPSGGETVRPDCVMMRRLLRAVAGGDLPFLRPSPVALGPNAATKEEAIGEMVASFAESGDLPEGEIQDILAAVLVRESLASTGIGEGVAIPHARHAAVRRVMGAIGWSAQGIEFDSVDHAPVRLVILLLSPPDGRAEHIHALANIARHLRSDRWGVDAPSHRADHPGATPLVPGCHG
jgi:nitrogen PTS system EIIA component